MEVPTPKKEGQLHDAHSVMMQELTLSFWSGYLNQPKKYFIGSK